jgi:RimJ/RimL family protein N-acetyltransferase
MQPSFLTGERIYLRGLEAADASGPYLTWFNDEEACRGNSHHIFPYYREDAEAYIRRARESRADLVLAIVLRENDCHIGNIALQGIQQTNRSAEFAIVIGDRQAWGRGLGKEAARLLCDHGFDAMNLNRIHCGTLETNDAMRRLAASLGMEEEGRRRQAVFKGGRYLDVIEYGVLRLEYCRGQRAAGHESAKAGSPNGARREGTS